jgi:hypothetical protein
MPRGENDRRPKAVAAFGARRRFSADDAVRVASLLWIGFALFAWAAVLAVEWDDDARLGRRDVRGYYAAGERLVQGGNAFRDQRLPLLPTPIVLPLARLYFALGMRGAYVLAAFLTSIGFLVGALVCAAMGEASRDRRATVALVIATSPAFYLGLHLGQLQGVYFALLAGSLALVLAGRPATAGGLAAFLLAKPHLAVGPVGLAFLLGRLRFFAGFALGALIALALALPFGGLARWAEWWTVLRETALRHDANPNGYWKQFTLYAFLRSAFYGADPGGTIARVVWAVTALGFASAIAVAVRRLRDRIAVEPALGARIAGLTALGICALNAYLFYYDAVLLAVPGAALATGRWHRRGARAIASACAALVWWLSLAVAWDRSHPQLAGAVTTLWLAIELFDLFGAPATSVAEAAVERVAERAKAVGGHRVAELVALGEAAVSHDFRADVSRSSAGMARNGP